MLSELTADLLQSDSEDCVEYIFFKSMLVLIPFWMPFSEKKGDEHSRANNEDVMKVIGISNQQVWVRLHLIFSDFFFFALLC